MTQPTTALLGLFAETQIHAGTGRTTGVIDLPIQREAHTDWPCVFGSAMKGALRAKAEDSEPAEKTDWITDVFGPDATGGKASDHAGALSVTDARLLLLPVRSLTSFYRWVTCPAILARYAQDYRRLFGELPFDAASLPAPTDKQAFVSQASGDLFLEEFRFKAEVKDKELETIVKAIATLLNPPHPGPLPPGEGVKKAAPSANTRLTQTKNLQERLTVVSDDMFTHLSRFATAVAAHIKIDNEHKTVKDGALWYEETLPPDTVLYTALLASASRRKDSEIPADQILNRVAGLFPPNREYLQIGGNETVGMGWCRVTSLPSPCGRGAGGEGKVSTANNGA